MDERRGVSRRAFRRAGCGILRAAVAALGVGIVVAGCNDDILGVDASHVLVLVSVNDQALPATLDEGGATRIFVADTIRLLGDGTWSRVQAQRWALSGEALRDLNYTSSGTLRESGNAFVLHEECNDVVIVLASCVPPDSLVATDGGWIIHRDLAPGQPVLRFEQFNHGGPR